MKHDVPTVVKARGTPEEHIWTPEEQTNALGNIIDGQIYARDKDVCSHTLSRVDI